MNSVAVRARDVRYAAVHLLRTRSTMLTPLTMVLFVFLLLVAGTVLTPGFASPGHVLLLLALSAFLGIVAVGQTVVILTGGIDLSIAWVMTAASVVFTGFTFGHTAKLPAGVLLALGIGCVGGLLNGLGVAVVRISPIVMTLATNSIFQSVALVYTNGTPFGFAPLPVQVLATRSTGGIPYIVLFWAALSGAVVLACHFTRFGRYLYSVGESPLVSYLSGIRREVVVAAAYVVSGASAALTGVLFAGFSRTSFLGMGDQFTLPSIAAVVLGGTSILGGRGSYGGTVVGAFFLTMLTTVLAIVNLSAGVRSIVYGVVIIAALLLNRLYSAGEEA
jgi:ribose transport system permease protein